MSKGDRAADLLWIKIEKYYKRNRIPDIAKSIQDVIFDSLDGCLYLVGRHPNLESDILADYDEMIESRQSYVTEPCIFGPVSRRFLGFDIKAYEVIER